MDNIETLIDALAQTPVSPDACNQYAPGDPNNDIRRHNLRLYFEQMAQIQPTMLFVGEAPGYRGCRVTGVPLVSRRILLEGIPELGLFGAGRGYLDTHDPGFERVQGEQSATIVWNTLKGYGLAPLIWGTFPFHPHQPGAPLTNRAPRRSEIATGIGFLKSILKMADFRQVIAVGNVAESALKSLGVPFVKVRHPAQGGKNDFVRGIQEVMRAISG